MSAPGKLVRDPAGGSPAQVRGSATDLLAGDVCDLAFRTAATPTPPEPAFRARNRQRVPRRAESE